MAIDKLTGVSGATPTPPAQRERETFNSVLQKSGGDDGGVSSPRLGVPVENAPRPVISTAARQNVEVASPGCAQATGGVTQARAPARVDAAVSARSVEAGRVLDQVTQAQKRLDHVLQLAHAGKSFTPAELIAMQAHVYRASQELDLAGKVVEKATGGVKQVLQTQL